MSHMQDALRCNPYLVMGINECLALFMIMNAIMIFISCSIIFSSIGNNCDTHGKMVTMPDVYQLLQSIYLSLVPLEASSKDGSTHSLNAAGTTNNRWSNNSANSCGGSEYEY